MTVRLSDDPVAVRFFQNSHNHPVSGRKEDGFPKSSEPFLPLNQLFSFSSCSYAALASRCRFSGFAGTALRAVTCLLLLSVEERAGFTGTTLRSVTCQRPGRSDRSRCFAGTALRAVTRLVFFHNGDYSRFAGTAFRAVTCLSNCTTGGIGNFTGTALGAVT